MNLFPNLQNIEHPTSDARQPMFSRERRRPAGGFQARADMPARRRRSRTPCSSSGIALIITLILVSVTAFMAMAFLILTQRERGAVTVIASQTDARLAADTATERVKVEIAAAVLAYGDPNRYGLQVSTNYLSPVGFLTGVASPTNVNYLLPNGNPVTGDDAVQNIANLQYNPRVPVYVVTNKQTGEGESRFYLDLNRNGRFDASGMVPELDASGVATGRTNFQVGDPEWIGILERPELPHSGSNLFTARYAYIVVPEGKTLDVNFIHNYSRRTATDMRADPSDDGYLRNQGVGSWEINLAAFLTDLNPNVWPTNDCLYAFSGGDAFGRGFVFDDALAILRYRYGRAYNNLAPATVYFGAANASAVFPSDNIDSFSDGPLMTGIAGIDERPPDQDGPSNPWSGSDNPNRYFTPQDLFDGNKTSPQFANRLVNAGTSNASHDRYTFYRLMEQLGTDSAGDDRMNLNYRNVDTSTGLVLPNMETNMIAWRPLDFFTNAANRLLSTLPTNQYFATVNGTNIPLSITNIPLFPTNFYTPAVHRLLQVAANLYDATTNSANMTASVSPQYPFLPHVYRPYFGRSVTNDVFSTNGPVTNVWISGYVEETTANNVNILDLEIPELAAIDNVSDRIDYLNAYNVPWVIGAKKDIPTFNEYWVQNEMNFTRKLEFRRKNQSVSAGDPNNTVDYCNQMYAFELMSSYGVEAWNSFSNAYPRQLHLFVTNEIAGGMITSNMFGYSPPKIQIGTRKFIPIPPNTWIGYTSESEPDPATVALSFQVPVNSNNIPLVPRTNIAYLQDPTGGFDSVNNNIIRIGPVQGYPLPQWFVYLTNRVRYALIDSSVNRVVDFVNLSAAMEPVDVSYKLGEPNNQVPGRSPQDYADGWATNRVGNSTSVLVPTVGITNQIMVSADMIPSGTVWREDASVIRSQGGTIPRSKWFFSYNLGLTNSNNDDVGIYKTNVFFSPYTANRTIYQYVFWRANDPLVHYTSGDLNDPTEQRTVEVQSTDVAHKTTNDLGTINKRYQPWAGIGSGVNDDAVNPKKAGSFNLAVKDPLVYRSDNWEFPTNKLPNLGWVGRVHRGTPWQTIYLKSSAVDDKTWTNWTGNIQRFIGSNRVADARQARPTNDWALLDLFTATPNDNAARGRLSVNQTNLAAWSAVLSGVIAVNNSQPPPDVGTPPSITTPVLIEPAGGAGASSPLGKIVSGINAVRDSTNFYGSFKHVGDVFATPELTVNSPFLNYTNAQQLRLGISDAMYERIPQQILGLLRHDREARFAIYAYGQSLKPAEQRAIIAPSGLCTNYQITGESVIRSVVRLTTNHQAVVESYNFLPPD